jgi:predicted nucleic acid-binding protein
LITAVDTNVLLDVFTADPSFGEPSRTAVRDARASGALVACEVVWAEVAAAFASRERAHASLERLEIEFSAMNVIAAVDAGASWRGYRRRGGARGRIVADFLIGAHAASSADRLLTRDRGFYRDHFSGLAIVDPSAAGPARG